MSELVISVWRCERTGNPVGTDAYIGQMCQCQGCRAGRRIEELEAAIRNGLPILWEASNQLRSPYTTPTSDPRVELDRKVMVREGEAVGELGERLSALLRSAGSEHTTVS